MFNQGFIDELEKSASWIGAAKNLGKTILAPKTTYKTLRGMGASRSRAAAAVAAPFAVGGGAAAFGAGRSSGRRAERRDIAARRGRWG